MIMKNEKNKAEESKEKKVGVIPADEIKGSDADGAYTGDEESPEEMAKQQIATDAAEDDQKSKTK